MVFYYNVERRGASYDGMIEEAVTLGAVPCIVNDRLGEIGSTVDYPELDPPTWLRPPSLGSA